MPPILMESGECLCGQWQVLSRAFRNRFMELHVDDIPDSELQTIVEQRCLIPPRYARNRRKGWCPPGNVDRCLWSLMR